LNPLPSTVLLRLSRDIILTMTQPHLDTYLDLCTQVYDLSKPEAPDDALAFYRSYARDALGPILEPMCGTGRFLIPLIEDGFDVQGFDASEHMLSALQAKAFLRRIKPNVWKGFLGTFEKPDTYNLIFIPAGSFGLIIDPDAVMSALRLFYDHLNHSGTLIFEGETLFAVPKQPGVWRESKWCREDGKLIKANFLDYPCVDSICSTTCKYELVDGKKTIQREFEDLKVRLHDPTQLMIQLKNVGFSHVRLVKAFDPTRAPDHHDELVIYECQK
jgi:hypothetical protein